MEHQQGVFHQLLCTIHYGRVIAVWSKCCSSYLEEVIYILGRHLLMSE